MNQESTFFSIVVPAYKRADLLEHTLRSLLTQTYSDFEVLVVDDGTPDNSIKESFLKHCAKDPRFKLITHKKNQGLPAARNTAIASSSGKYISLLDSDDLYTADTLSLLHNTIIKTNYPSILVGTAINIKSDTEDIPNTDNNNHQYNAYENYFQYRRRNKDWWFAPSGVTLKSEAIKNKIAFWSGRTYCEDIDYWLKTGALPGFVKIDSPPTYGYRIHEQAMTKQFASLSDGILRIIKQEKSGEYEKFNNYKKERIKIILAQSRHLSTNLSVKHSSFRSLILYANTFTWNFSQKKFKYLIGLPFYPLLHRISPRLATQFRK